MSLLMLQQATPNLKWSKSSTKNKGGIGALYRRALNVIFEQSIKLPG